MNIKNSGVIDDFADSFDIGTTIYPAFFIGRIFPWPPGAKAAWTGPGLLLDPDKRFEDGQFVHEHQYEGHACSSRKLFGIFLPLSTASDPKMVDKFQPIVRDYHPMQPNTLTDQEALRLTNVLEDVGPLYARKEDIEEAFIRVATKDAFPWIAEHFKYITSFVADIGGKGKDADWRIGETKRTPWKTLEEFAQWLGEDRTKKMTIPEHLIPQVSAAWIRDEDQVKAASEIYTGLIYQNSD